MKPTMISDQNQRFVLLIALVTIFVSPGNANLSKPQRELAGESICTYSPDYECYEDGWPECCFEDDLEDSCKDLGFSDPKPPCDVDEILGGSVCTWAPDYDCYLTGWPPCCNEGNGTACEGVEKDCDNDDSEDSDSEDAVDGSSGAAVKTTMGAIFLFLLSMVF